jgi:hypothetical protein
LSNQSTSSRYRSSPHYSVVDIWTHIVGIMNEKVLDLVDLHIPALLLMMTTSLIILLLRTHKLVLHLL